MKHCRLHRGIADQSAIPPGCHHTGSMAAILRAHAMPEAEIASAEAEVYVAAIGWASQAVREIAMQLPNTRQGRALRIALTGTDGRPLSAHAAEIGANKGTLCRDIERMRERVARAKMDNAAAY